MPRIVYDSDRWRRVTKSDVRTTSLFMFMLEEPSAVDAVPLMNKVHPHNHMIAVWSLWLPQCAAQLTSLVGHTQLPMPAPHNAADGTQV